MSAAPAWTIHTEVFDGPLDLLLYLVKRDGVDVSRLKIADICDAYLGYLDRMREMRLELASDYLVMAATLCHLKALALLPRLPTPVTDDGEPEDPTQTLADQLEQYARVRAAAEALGDRPLLGRDVFAPPGVDVDAVDRPVTAGIDAFGLLDLYWDLLAKQAAGPPTHTLPRDGPDLFACCEAVLAHLDAHGGKGELGEILQTLGRRVERVVAFVATLEMCRLRWIGLRQTRHLGPVELWYEDRDAVDLGLLTGHMVGEGAE